MVEEHEEKSGQRVETRTERGKGRGNGKEEGGGGRRGGGKGGKKRGGGRERGGGGGEFCEMHSHVKPF